MRTMRLLRIAVAPLVFAAMIGSLANIGARASGAEGNRGPVPIIPVIVEYEYAAQYFMQWISDNPKYSMIEAIIGAGQPRVIQMILTETKSERRVIYTDSESKVKALTGAGEEARAAKIDFKVANNVGHQPTFGFAFADERGKAIRWRFIPAAAASALGKGLSPQSDAAGLRFRYRERATTAGAGTAVQIDDKVSEAEPWPEVSSPPYFVAYRGSYVEGIHLGALLVGNRNWRVTSAPAELIKGSTWTLTSDGNQTRQMGITSRKADELTINETTEWGSLDLTVRTTVQGLAVRSIVITSAGHKMRFTFKPDLELESEGVGAAKAEVAFQIDEDDHEKVSQGTVTVDRAKDTVLMRWQPKTPDWAKSRSLTSTITLDSLGYAIEVR
ncbi:MAG: hypothetical protein DMF61_23185 [Blastocatellia bacterium AA13]|nr:MAG: hypothetical protein DMF61_23185 [Blastocatellia bacterium AA13]